MASDAGDRAHAVNSAWARVASCADITGIDWFLDERVEAPQAWRLAMVMTCCQPVSLVDTYATCSQDIAARDRGKLVSELAPSRVSRRA